MPKSTNFLGVPVNISATKKGCDWTLLKSAWPHPRSNGPRVRPKGGAHKTVCLKLRNRTHNEIEAGICNVCVGKDSLNAPVRVDLPCVDDISRRRKALMSRQVIINVHFWERNDLLTEQRLWELNCLIIHGELRVLTPVTLRHFLRILCLLVNFEELLGLSQAKKGEPSRIVSRHALIGSVNIVHAVDVVFRLISHRLCGEAEARTRSERTDSVWLCNRLNCPKTQAVSGKLRTTSTAYSVSTRSPCTCLMAKIVSENRLAHDIMFDCKVSLRHVRFDVLLHLTQAFSRTVEVTIYIAHDSYRMSTCTTVYVTQCCSEVNEDGLWRGRWVAAQKPSYSIWQGKPACWETTGVQPWLPGPSVIMRGGNGHGRAHHNDNILNKLRLEEQVIWGAHEAEARLRGRKLKIENITRQKPEDTY